MRGLRFAPLLLVLSVSLAQAAAMKVPKRPREFPPTGPAPQETKRNPLDFIIRNLRMTTPVGPLLFIPLVDTNKDIGFRSGIMPIWAFRDRRGDGIAAVLAPSVRYNRFLKTEYTGRAYFFPNERDLVVVRGSYSSVVNREIFLRYFTREFLGTNFRLNTELHLFRDGKFSFYGFGPDSVDGDQANFSKYKIGEEVTVGIPTAKHWFLELSHSNFQYQLGAGPITNLRPLSEVFPNQAILGWKRLVSHGAAITYDSTDHPSLPTRGGLITLSARTAQTALGSDYTCQTYASQLKYYQNMVDGKYVTVANLYFEQQRGDILPFYAQTVVGESTGLRLEGDGRFVDRGRMVFNIEERIRVARSPLLKFFSEVEISPFLDVGTVFPQPGKLRFDNLQPGPGIAARVLLRPQVVITADVAWRGSKKNFILKVDYPF
ncbi:MAG: BamA/TamA family outer membrane protein [Elusimicrobiota bacterium]